MRKSQLSWDPNSFQPFVRPQRNILLKKKNWGDYAKTQGNKQLPH